MSEPGKELAKYLGKNLVPPDIQITGDAMQADDLEVIKFAMQVAMVGQMGAIRQALEEKARREHWEGPTDPRTLSVTDRMGTLDLVLDWPFHPWISAFAINYGADTVKLAINEPFGWIEIPADQTRTLNQVGANKRIDRIYYVCDPGETASVTIEGQY